ncbi:hypothetical protein NPX13_g1625 [Xylaria arbuscula]|uniref:Uncharacterized protein n=1 Tax=Xylaria arbuscula TaxID=114810 RepID=A0A9W8NLP7_9PEZI|nr:hypothetical protein NPX13_g1625 [Xylaria arbuscula]
MTLASGFSARNKRFDTALIRPVTEDPVGKVDTCFDRLGVEEAVHHILQLSLKINWDLRVSAFEHVFTVLHSGRDAGTAFGQFHAHVADTAPDVDLVDVPETRSVVIVDDAG